MLKKIVSRYDYSIILLKQLVKTDFKLRYQNSALGYLWSLLRPLALFVIMYVVFVKFLRVDYGVPHSALYLLVGLVIWNYFTEVTMGSVGTIVGRGDLLRKISFPKYVIVLSGSFAALINLGLNFLVITLFMVISRVVPPIQIIFLPLLIIELFVFSLSIAFFLSALFVKYRDVNYIWEVIVQAGFYVTPIFYPLSMVPPKIAKILMLNPLAQIVQDARHIIVTTQSPTITTIYGSPYARLIPFSIVFVVAILASKYFKKRSKYFAEEI